MGLCQGVKPERVRDVSAQSVLVKGPAAVSGDDDVIQHLDLQPIQHFLQFASEFLVIGTGTGFSIRMIVRKNHRSRIVGQSAPCDFSRIDRSAREGPLEQGFAGNQTVPDIKKQRDEALIALPGKLRQKKMF